MGDHELLLEVVYCWKGKQGMTLATPVKERKSKQLRREREEREEERTRCVVRIEGREV